MARFTSVANVKAYLGGNMSSSQDGLLLRLIARESTTIEKWTGRSFGKEVVTNRRLNGTGTDTIVLHEQPIRSIEALNVDGVVFTASSSVGGYGYLFDETSISLVGAKFGQGRGNVLASWTAGYFTTENGVIPTGNAPTLPAGDADLGFPLNDYGVTFGNGVVMIAAASNAPLAGQYYFDAGLYTFNSADANAPVRMTFDYAPADVEQACIEMIGLDLKQRDNIGVLSKTLAGESITYDKSNMSKSAREQLQPYRRMTPA